MATRCVTERRHSVGFTRVSSVAREPHSKPHALLAVHARPPANASFFFCRVDYFLHASQPWLHAVAQEAHAQVEHPHEGHLAAQVQTPEAQEQLVSQEQAMVRIREGAHGNAHGEVMIRGVNM